MKGRQLLGMLVVGSGGWSIGKVRDIVFDEHTWKVGSLRVQLAREVADQYRMRRLLARTQIEVGVETVQAIGDHVVLSVTKSDLRRRISRLPEPRTPVATSPASVRQPAG